MSPPDSRAGDNLDDTIHNLIKMVDQIVEGLASHEEVDIQEESSLKSEIELLSKEHDALRQDIITKNEQLRRKISRKWNPY